MPTQASALALSCVSEMTIILVQENQCGVLKGLFPECRVSVNFLPLTRLRAAHIGHYGGVVS